MVAFILKTELAAPCPAHRSRHGFSRRTCGRWHRKGPANGHELRPEDRPRGPRASAEPACSARDRPPVPRECLAGAWHEPAAPRRYHPRRDCERGGADKDCRLLGILRRRKGLTDDDVQPLWWSRC